MAENLHERAAAAVDVQVVSARRLHGVIAVNPKFRPRELSELHGVDPYKAPEVAIASEALVRLTLDALGSSLSVLSIREWIERESKKRGGKGQLAAALLGIPYQRGAMGKNRRYMNTLRALQRSSTSAKEAHKGMADEYRSLVAQFPGGELGNPYAPVGVRARAALRASKAQLAILGDWTISKRTYTYAWKGTELEPADTFNRVWSFPDSFIEETLVAMATGYLRMADIVELEWLYGLAVIIELPAQD